MKIKSYNLVIFILAVLFFSCKKDQVEPLSTAPAALKYSIQDMNVHITWDAGVEKPDNFTVELSKLSDFSMPDDIRTVQAPEHIYRNLNAGGVYYVRVKSNRLSPASSSEWSTLKFTILPGNILTPVSEQDINGTTVNIKWAFDSGATEALSRSVTKVVLTPLFGQARVINLSSQDTLAKTLKIENLVKDMQYTVRIYNGTFTNGVQVFTTLAEAVNGVWTLSPYSDLKSAIRDSRNGDVILLKPGIYNAWQKQVSIDSKSITIKPQTETSPKPKLYIKSFDLLGTGAGLSLIGLDISGSRLDEYKEEIPNTIDTRWNNWLVTLNSTATDMDHLMIKNCVIRHYWTGMLQMNGNAQKANSVTIDNSIVHNIGGDNTTETIAVNRAGLKTAHFTNSTFYMINKMFIAVDRENITLNDLNFLFKNNTVDQSWSTGAFSFKGMKSPAKVLLQNNIFSNINSAANFFANFAFLANTFEKRLINCNFHNVLSKSTIYGSNLGNMPVHTWELRHPNATWTEVKPSFIMNDAQHINPNSIKEYPVSFNPGYQNAGAMDFKVSATSPLRSLDNGNPIGDPRWW